MSSLLEKSSGREFKNRFPEFRQETTHLQEIHDIFISSLSNSLLKVRLIDFLSTYPGYRIFFEKNLYLGDTNCHFNYGQNPTCSLYLFSSECRNSTNCSGPCLFKHSNSIRPSDLKAIVKFKLIMIQILLSILNHPDEILFNNYKKEDYTFLEESSFRMNIGDYSSSKLILMNHVYEGTLFLDDKTLTSIKNKKKNELEPKISYCRHQNKVRTLDFIFVLSLCHLPIELEEQFYSLMSFNNNMTNLEMSQLKIKLYNEIKKLFSPDDSYIIALKSEQMEINSFIKDCIQKVLLEIMKLSLKQQEHFLYHTPLKQKLEKRNTILTSQ